MHTQTLRFAPQTLVGAFLFLAGVTGCGRDQPLGLAAAVQPQLRIEPDALELFRDQSFRFDVLRSAGGGAVSVLAEEDLSVEIRPAGLAIARTDGTAVATGSGAGELIARLGAQEARASIAVRDAQLTALRVTPSTLDLSVGGRARLRVTGVLSNGSEIDLTAGGSGTTYLSSSDAVSVGLDGDLLGRSAGGAAITVTQGAFVESVTVNVSDNGAELVGLEVQPSPLIVRVGTEARLTVVGVRTDGTNINLTENPELSADVDRPDVAVLTGTDSVAGIGPGTARLLVSYRNLEGVADIQVSADTNPVIRVEFRPGSLNLPVNGSADIRIFAVRQSGAEEDITSNPGLSTTIIGPISASPGANGTLRLTGTAPGDAEIEARFGGRTASLSVTVQNATSQVAFISITSFPSQLEVGRPSIFTVTARFVDGTQRDITAEPSLEASSSDTSVMRVEAPGLIRGVSIGRAVLSASFGGSRSTRTIDVVASPQVVGVTWLPGQVSIPVNQTENARVFAFRQGAASTNVTASIETSFAATGPISISLSPGGFLGVTATGNGPARVTATYRGFRSDLFVAAGNAPSVVELVVSPPSPLSLTVGDTQQLSASVRFSDGSTAPANNALFQVIAPPSQGAPISVSSTGLITALAPGQGRLFLEAGGRNANFIVNVSAER